jgi:hypothetical protein
MTYELYYWPGIQGRGEFVRLALEQAGAPYVDVARERGPGRGVAAMTKMLKGDGGALAPFAPPFLKDGEIVVSHAANILAYLAPRLGLAPPGEALRLFAHGLQVTVTDFVEDGGAGARDGLPRPPPAEIPRLFRARAAKQCRRRRPSRRRRADLCRSVAVPAGGGPELRIPQRHGEIRGEVSGAGGPTRQRESAAEDRRLSRFGAPPGLQRGRNLPPLPGAGRESEVRRGANRDCGRSPQ